jgi:hypothetical protein
MRYSTQTTVSPAQALLLARSAFGGEGAGLRVSDLTLTSARFTSAAGFIAVKARLLPDGATEVVLETREFDAEARRFLVSLPRQTWLRAALRWLRAKL